MNVLSALFGYIFWPFKHFNLKLVGGFSIRNIVLCHDSNIPILVLYISAGSTVKRTQWMYFFFKRRCRIALAGIGYFPHSELGCWRGWSIIVKGDFFYIVLHLLFVLDINVIVSILLFRAKIFLVITNILGITFFIRLLFFLEGENHFFPQVLNLRLKSADSLITWN